MVVTKLFKTSIICGALLYFSACGVKNTSETTGSITCNPSTTDVNNFQTQVLQSALGFQAGSGSDTCITCHGNGVSATTGQTVRSRFRLMVNSPTAQDKINNLCAAYSFGQASPSLSLINHPRDPKHSGGVFSTGSIQAIIDWVNVYRLPAN